MAHDSSIQRFNDSCSFSNSYDTTALLLLLLLFRSFLLLHLLPPLLHFSTTTAPTAATTTTTATTPSAASASLAATACSCYCYCHCYSYHDCCCHRGNDYHRLALLLLLLLLLPMLLLVLYELRGAARPSCQVHTSAYRESESRGSKRPALQAAMLELRAAAQNRPLPSQARPDFFKWWDEHGFVFMRSCSMSLFTYCLGYVGRRDTVSCALCTGISRLSTGSSDCGKPRVRATMFSQPWSGTPRLSEPLQRDPAAIPRPPPKASTRRL